MAVTNCLINTVLGGGITDVAEDGWAVGDGFGITPGTEAIAECEHIGIGSHARIPKQVPGAADHIPPFEDDETLPRALHLQMESRTNPRQPRPHNYYVHMFHR